MTGSARRTGTIQSNCESSSDSIGSGKARLKSVRIVSNTASAWVGVKSDGISCGKSLESNCGGIELPRIQFSIHRSIHDAPYVSTERPIMRFAVAVLIVDFCFLKDSSSTTDSSGVFFFRESTGADDIYYIVRLT